MCYLLFRSLLSHNELQHIPQVVSFAQKFLGVTQLYVQFFYHAEQERMDIKMKAGSQFCYIQFEPGFPDTYFNEDLWDVLN